MKRFNQITVAVALAATALVACGDDPSTPSNPTPSPSSNIISQTYQVSECGGFEANASQTLDSGEERGDEGGDEAGEAIKPVTGPSAPADPPPVSEYCAAERLHFAYDALTGALKLSNARVMLNCCGEHSVKLEKKADGAYELREVDAPEMVEIAGKMEPGRCGCTCPFDFELAAEDIPAGTIEIRIVREVTDSSAPADEVYAGTLDLSQGQGSVVVDRTESFGFCE